MDGADVPRVDRFPDEMAIEIEGEVSRDDAMDALLLGGQNAGDNLALRLEQYLGVHGATVRANGAIGNRASLTQGQGKNG